MKTLKSNTSNFTTFCMLLYRSFPFARRAKGHEFAFRQQVPFKGNIIICQKGAAGSRAWAAISALQPTLACLPPSFSSQLYQPKQSLYVGYPKILIIISFLNYYQNIIVFCYIMSPNKKTLLVVQAVRGCQRGNLNFETWKRSRRSIVQTQQP